jgi:hypothetical protein
MMSESKFGFEPEPPPIDPALEFAPTPVKRSEMRPVFEVDRAAKLAGFESREPRPVRRRRRAVREARNRFMAVRFTEANYDRFVRFADAKNMTYADAIMHLMDLAEGKPGQA